MDFDQMLEAWRAQNTAPPYDVNRDALRQALQTEAARVRREMRDWRRVRWFLGIFGTGMAVWAGFWIAITLTNGRPVLYAITAGVSLGLFALGAGAWWLSRGREPGRNFGNTLQEEVRRSLALVDDQLSIARRWILSMLGVASLVAGAFLFSWTLTRSQIPDSSSGGWIILFVIWLVWAAYKSLDAMRQMEPKLELRQRRLRELLASLEVRE